jgi:hypothetical protein
MNWYWPDGTAARIAQSQLEIEIPDELDQAAMGAAWRVRRRWTT